VTSKARTGSGAKKQPPKAPPKKRSSKVGLLKSATRKVATTVARLRAPAKLAKLAKPSKPAQAAKPAAKPGKVAPARQPLAVPAVRLPERQRPRATKLPPVGEALTRREMEQILTAAAGRGVTGEGSLKGRLVVKDGLPCLHVVGRDKRELVFLLQGPDQEVLPAYVDHKVSVTGLIKKSHNYGGVVEVRKYSAKKPEAEGAEPAPAPLKLSYLSPGELEQVANPGMGAGMRGFATLRGSLEMTGDAYVLVVSNGGTRQQVSFLLEGKLSKSMRKSIGHPVQVSGVMDKTSGWGGRVAVEVVELRPHELRSVSRDNLDVLKVEGNAVKGPLEVKMNNGLSITLPERSGHMWAIEPTLAKRVGLREANFHPAAHGPGVREFFFTPRNPGVFDVDFFLAKAFAPAQVHKTVRLTVSVKA
jgi:hypothetical protein